MPHYRYMDYAAATPLLEEAALRMSPFQNDMFANPSAVHKMGVEARCAVEEARRAVAGAIGARPIEIVFTSGGTEANNLAILGTVRMAIEAGIQSPKIITSVIEHESVLSACREAEALGARVTYLPVSPTGIIDAKEVLSLVDEETILVSVMLANNEVGTIQPIDQIGRAIYRSKRAVNSVFPYFHSDACQCLGQMEIAVERLHVDLLAINSGKIYGPKGVGALFIREGRELRSMMFGGGQERGIRSGTENVPGIVGFGVAALHSVSTRENEASRLTELREYFISKLCAIENGLVILGDRSNRLPNNISFSVPGIDREDLVIAMDARGFAISTGSACASKGSGLSHVIEALKVPRPVAAGAVRATLGAPSTKEDIDAFLNALSPTLALLRKSRFVGGDN